MGNTERMAAKVFAALICVVSLLAVAGTGDDPNLGPIVDLAQEVIATGGAGTLSFILMQRFKTWFPKVDKLRQSYIHIALAMSLGPLAWYTLILMNLGKLSQEGLAIVMLGSITVGKQIYQHYKNSKEEMVRERVQAFVGNIPQGHDPQARLAGYTHTMPIAPVQWVDTDEDTDLSNSGDVTDYVTRTSNAMIALSKLGMHDKTSDEEQLSDERGPSGGY